MSVFLFWKKFVAQQDGATTLVLTTFVLIVLTTHLGLNLYLLNNCISDLCQCFFFKKKTFFALNKFVARAGGATILALKTFVLAILCP